IRVRIPATTANLGPGYDCMGLALDLWNTFEMHPRGPGYSVRTFGEGAEILPTNEANLTLSTFLSECKNMGVAPPEGVHLVCHSTVPCASGLGSSSTATLAGVLFAFALKNRLADCDPADLDRSAVLERAISIEGHGDNVAPALMGGFVIVMPDESGVLTQRVPIAPLKVVVCVPEFDFPTSKARAALPDSYSKEDAIYNIGRAMIVAEALRSGDDAMLARAMRDRIHEPYRLDLIPGARSVQSAALDASAICVALSGAGPGIIAFAREGFDRIGRAMKDAFTVASLRSRYWILDATSEGADITRLPV
ncbi:MAG TPA: homoserine kinase, partial [Fimbriimonadaceae bacterium]|nr:homoserine kinase [Fimbriimonadaceae bacterium]